MKLPLDTLHQYRVALLVVDLRSGKNEQGKQRLRTQVWETEINHAEDTPREDLLITKFCCLGRGCDVSGLGRWVSISDEYVVGDNSFGDRYKFPWQVAEWFFGEDINMGDCDPTLLFEETNVKIPASVANDGGYTFLQIARAFELTFLGGEKAEDIVARVKPA